MDQLQPDEDVVYRAILKKGPPTDKAFRRRPTEETLSIAKTPEKAVGDLECYGWVSMRVNSILAIEGLKIQVKDTPGVPRDPDLLEISGVPPFGDPEAADFAEALLKTVHRWRDLPVRRKKK